MATYLIDYENPGGQAFFKYIKKRPLTENDKIILFYSEHPKPTEEIISICNEAHKYNQHGIKNGLDFLLVTYLGSIIADDGF
jgi:hypothetical protein